MRTDAVLRIGITLATAALPFAFDPPGVRADIINVAVFRDVDGGANAVDVGTASMADTFSYGPTTEPVLAGGGTTQFDKSRERGNAYGRAQGLLQFLFSQEETTASGRLTEVTRRSNGSTTAAAQAGFDATIGVDFSVDVETEYQL
jgi:hypothetical protein